MRLTPRQVEILSLYSRGLKTVEIMALLHVERETIRTHLKIIRGELGARTTAQCIVLAVARGHMEIDRDHECAGQPNEAVSV